MSEAVPICPGCNQPCRTLIPGDVDYVEGATVCLGCREGGKEESRG